MKSNIVIPSEEPIFLVLGNLLQFLNEPGKGQDDLSLMTAVLPAGIIIPLHSHADPEFFFLLEGSLDVYQESADWNTAMAGQLITIPGNVKHALRNTTSETARAILVSKAGIHNFFRELAQPFSPDSVPHPPTQEEMEVLFEAAERHGYWIGSSTENAAIGITLA